MKSLFFPMTALALLAVTIIVHWQHYVPLLPERMASHIDASGKANQWTDKATFLNGSRMFFLIVPVALLGLTALSALSVLYLPESMVNVPRKEYWLATPGRRQLAALLTIRFFLWFGFGLVALLYFGVIHAMVLATLDPETNFNYMGLPLFAFGLIFIFTQVGLLIYRLLHLHLQQ